MKPVSCPICGKEKLWRKAKVLGILFRAPVMCQCEIEQEEAAKRQAEEREKQRKIERVFAMSNLGARFAGATFESWKRDTKTDSCFEAVRDYAEAFSRDTAEGLCIYGRAGNGKSHLAAALVNSVIASGYTAIFYEVPELFSKIKATFDSREGGSETQILDALATCDLLVLDDAGAERPSEWVQEKFYQIINRRYKNNKPVIITTNTKDMAGLEEIIGFRAYDRVLEMCRPVKNSGDSYRRSIAVERLKHG
jgi:DNA replication protein DnaC